MTTFWIVAATLTVAALSWLAFALWRQRPSDLSPTDAPLAREATLQILRDQLTLLDGDLARGIIDADQHRLGREEVERRVLEETDLGAVARSAAAASTFTAERPWKTMAVMALGVPLLAGAIYAHVGQPKAVLASASRGLQADTDGVTVEQVQTLVKQLAERMQSRPDDVQGWTLLARTYAAMQRFPEASSAYAKAVALAPQDAQLLTDHADVLAVLQGQKLAGEPTRLIAQALVLDPTNLKALALAGSSAFEAQDFSKALGIWTRARELAPPGSEFANGLDASIEEARKNLPPGTQIAAAVTAAASAAAVTTMPTSTATPAAAAAAARVSGRVTLAPALAGKAAPTDVVFIFARAAEGPRMPLAILRRTVADLPMEFTLDDSLAMSPAMTLSTHPLVVVGARISKSGNAMPSSGDMSGQVTNVKTGTTGLSIVIDTVTP
jgi:cytochrome c-type biogenesis protein CcmH